MGRPGQSLEVGPAYVFLACRDSSYMTGQVLHINVGEIIGGLATSIKLQKDLSTTGLI
ncbi:hypothetical protein SAMN05421636_11129 [Pricia antarctica]|uniref:Enoyl-(Acyl carrier protein) reductase n=1 Tax=Pricia antarctica TaxID=641691 RepID=A0A1G7I608_9FLAO|nr:hypothetical protein SAMN05421636_11129 [Pricia antarctica]